MSHYLIEHITTIGFSGADMVDITLARAGLWLRSDAL